MASLVLVLSCSGLAAPWQPFAAWRSRHAALLREAKGAVTESGPAEPQPAVPWPRLWQELRATSDVAVVPASALSLALAAAELAKPTVVGRLFDAALAPSASLGALLPLLKRLAALALAQWALEITVGFLFARARWRQECAARVRLMAAVLRQEPAFFDAQAPGELASRLLSEPQRLQEAANRGPERAVRAALTVVGALALMVATDWRLALVAVALRAPLLAKLAVAAGRVVGLYGVVQQRRYADANSLASEALSQAHTVAAHAAGDAVLRDYEGRVAAYQEVIGATLLTETILRFTRLLLDQLTSFLLLAAGLVAVLRGTVSIGQLTALLAFSESFARGGTELLELGAQLSQLRPSVSRFIELLDREPAMAWEEETDADSAPPACAGALELRNVSFGFAGREAAAVRDVSFRVEAGGSLAIVGPSGAGKSTVLKLLQRLYDPSGGAVLLDGRDARELPLGWYRRCFGRVPQEPRLFDRSVADNVNFGLEARRGAAKQAAAVAALMDGGGGGGGGGGEEEEEALARALADADAAEFVAALPQGAHTPLGEGGGRLSGGQRQRLAIARALVRRPKVLLLDEASSSLDATAERLVQRALGATNATVVLVAHRLSSVLLADSVVVIEDGVVTERGTADELRAKGGWFARNFYPV